MEVQPRFQGLPSLPLLSLRRKAEKRDPGNEVGGVKRDGNHSLSFGPFLDFMSAFTMREHSQYKNNRINNISVEER